MDFLRKVKTIYCEAVDKLYGVKLNIEEVLINETRKEFEGDFTFVIFTLVSKVKKSPEQIGQEIGDYLVNNSGEVINHNTIKGFLNVTLSDEFWVESMKMISQDNNYGFGELKNQKVLVEFASPNTNKPLHLGHIRNILLGWSCSKILKANGYEVLTTQVINDRGIAICKSMVAWQKFAKGATPTSENIKPDHFVGEYYVKFEQAFVEEYKAWQITSEAIQMYKANKKENQDETAFFKEYKNQYFNNYSALGAEAKQMLIDWEGRNPDVMALWQMMNDWVYQGFETTYNDLGVSFDSLYYESDTYLLGKEAIAKGLQSNVFTQDPDGSVWVDLSDVGMDRKIVMRSDGTSVYITQDIGTAQQRYKDFGINRMVYTVADEQDYHFKVLFEILRRLEEPYANGLFHLSYGMIELPTGRMKSREGTVVDADDIIKEVIDEASSMAHEKGEINALSEEEKRVILHKIGLAALKYFIIKVNPRKKMIFDPTESVDMQGQTGPYIQNAYVRIQSVLRKSKDLHLDLEVTLPDSLKEQEKTLLKLLFQFPSIVEEAGRELDPSTIANYSYLLAKEYHRFYHDLRILNGESLRTINFRVMLSEITGRTLFLAFNLLGIEMPERM